MKTFKNLDLLDKSCIITLFIYVILFIIYPFPFDYHKDIMLQYSELTQFKIILIWCIFIFAPTFVMALIGLFVIFNSLFDRINLNERQNN